MPVVSPDFSLSVETDPNQRVLDLEDVCDLEPAPRPAGAIHDLANLLSVIVAVNEALAEALEPEPKHAELAKVGLLAAERAADLVGQMRGPAPAERALGAPSERSVPPAGKASGEPASVLVVDDDPRLLNLMSTAFTRAGYRTFSAKNGRVALQILRAAKPDLLVTDIVMPEMEGLATIREARSASPDTGVIAISGGGQYERHERFLNWAEGLGADEVLAKPFKISSLLTAARLVLDRRDGAAVATH